jgi:hypothetical protein
VSGIWDEYAWDEYCTDDDTNQSVMLLDHRGNLKLKEKYSVSHIKMNY